MTLINITGSDLSGSNPSKTYNISTNATEIKVWVGGLFFYKDTDYTFSSGVITFNKTIYDTSPIAISYTDSSLTSESDCYTTNLKIAQISGVGFDIKNEEVGTGDNSTASFDLDNGNIISGSYTIKYSDGGNSFTELIEDTDYTINNDGGTILLTASGITKLGTNILYADYTHSPKISDTQLTEACTQATAEVDKITEDYWGSPKDNYEIFDWENYNYANTEEPYVSTNVLEDETIQLKYKGINSLNGVYILQTNNSFISALAYDSSGDSYTDNINYVNSQSSAAFFPFASTPASSDYLYLGSNYMFHSINFINAIQGVLSTSESNVLQYYDGSSWIDISATESVTGVLNLTANGSVSWSRLPSWTKTTINSQGEYYFIRLKNLNTYSTVPKVSMIYQGQDFVINEEIDLYKVRYNSNGEIVFSQNTLKNGKQKLRIEFNHGYSSVPTLAQELASVIGGIISLVRISGGSYDTPSTYNLGRKNFSIGQLWVNIDNSLKQLRERYNSLLNQIGKKMSVV